MPESGPESNEPFTPREGSPAPRDAGESTRVTLRFSPEARNAIDEIMRMGHMDTMQEAVRRAIGDELFLLRERRAGWKVLLQKGNKFREVNWPDF